MDHSLPVFAYWHSADHSILADFLADWRPHFPQLRVIGDADVEPLIAQILPEYVSLYRRIRFPAAKANIARLAYLHEYGGLYIDCHCGLLSASGVRELFGKLNSCELVLWEHSYIEIPRPRNKIRPITSILLARPRSSTVRVVLLRALGNLASYSRHQASYGLPDSNQWELCGAGMFSKVLIAPGSNDTHLKSEFEGRIYFSGLDDGPIARYRHNAYKTDPEQHWDKRRRRELLFEPETWHILACVYTCEQHRSLLGSFYESPVGKYLLGSPNTRIFEVYANPDIDRSYHSGRKLVVRTPESYETLVMKTLEMITYCVSHFQFRRLLKIDVTTIRTTFEGPEYKGRVLIDIPGLVQFLKESPWELDYDGFASREDAMTWAAKKRIMIEYEQIFGDKPISSFFAGKCYILSRSFAEFVSEHGGDIAQQHVAYMPAEDVMIRRLFKEFTSARASSLPVEGSC